MRELRKDPVLGRWVIIATDRADRPYEFKKGERFGETPCGWCDDAPTEASVCTVPSEHAIVDRHEMIVESPDHDRPFDCFTDAEALRVIEAWCARLDEHEKNPANAYALVFKNNAMTDRLGRHFVKHARSEIVPLPEVPKRVREEMGEAARWRGERGGCLFCAVVESERAKAERIVDENASFTAFCPYASHSPYETMILPRRHQTDLRETTLDEKKDFARILKSALGRIRARLQDSPYYFVLHSAPFARGGTGADYHWHVEIAPRTFYAAGFEWGGGVYINPILPEAAARELREAPWTR